MEIKNRAELRKILNSDRELYFGGIGSYQRILKKIKGHPDYYAWKYVRQMRITSYFYTKRKSNVIYAFLYLYHSRLFFSKGRKLGIESGENVFDEGLRIYHTQGIVVNGNARVGKNCYLYGNNCIGNNGILPACPQIGDGVRICVGAKVIGDVVLANGVIVSAGAVVVKSCLEENAILAGVPAKIIGYNTKPFMN